jgi:hypothetical protein
MNRLPPTVIIKIRGLLPRALALLLLACCAWPGSTSLADAAARYRIDYRISLDPEAGGARVEMRLRQPERFLREFDMGTLDGRLSAFEGDGELTRGDGRVTWHPPDDGGSLRWFAELSHRRNGDGYDAYIEDDWALFRFEDVIPSADTRTLMGTESDTRVTFELPRGWSVVTPYREEDERWRISNPERRFDTPTGWIVAGDLGVRIEMIGGVRVVVAGPVEHAVRRMDILALMHWTLPDLQRLLPRFPERLTVVSAGEPMWRGALSAPQSLYLHADRPLLSGNATSTLLHEIVHIGLGLSDRPGADWIVEGLAEYYSLEVLRRSGTISEERFRKAHRELANWARDAKELCTQHSTGSGTALAVTVMVKLDAEIREATAGRASMDDVLEALGRHSGKISVGQFREIATRIAGTTLGSLRPAQLRGCAGD